MNYALSEDAIKFLCSNGGKVDFDEFTGGETPPPIPIECGGTNANNSEEALLNLGGLSTKLLWQNASPTSTFQKQTKTLDLSKYDAIEIEFGMMTSSLYRTSVKCSLLDSVILVGTYSFGGSGKIMGLNRVVVISNKTSVLFDDAWMTTPSSDTLNNNVCIPLAIYGIKGVL